MIEPEPPRRGRPVRRDDEPERLTRAELSRMADVAREKGVQIEAEIGDRIIRVMPVPAQAVTIDRVVIPEGGVRL